MLRRTAPSPSGRPAFTLVEILVSIAIIAVLTSIALPSLAGARSTARRLKCLTQLKGLGTAFELYMKDSKGLLPRVTPFYDVDLPSNPNDPQLLDLLEQYTDVKAPYYDENDKLIVHPPYLCPEDNDLDAGRQTGFSYQYWPGVLMLAREVFRADPNPPFTVTKFYEDVRNRDWPVLSDWRDWHPGNPLTKKNALHYGDWRADWLIMDPESASQPPPLPDIPPIPPPP
jgi:prepilin-type N-terminal cleavage/methylation domain-containing protein